MSPAPRWTTARRSTSGFVGAAGALVAFWLLTNIAAIGSTLMLIVVSLFLAAGLNPAVTFFERRGLRAQLRRGRGDHLRARSPSLLFLVAIVPVITDQVRSITDQAPGWFDRLQNNKTVQDLDDEYDVIDKARDYVTGGDFVGTLFGGALGIGLAVLGALFNAFIVLVLTLYFLSSLDDHQDRALPPRPRLAPRPGHPARQPDHRERRRLRLRRVHRRDVRRASPRWSSCSPSASASTPWRWPSSSRCST